MSTERTNPTWREKIGPAAIAGLISGIVRAAVTWALDLVEHR